MHLWKWKHSECVCGSMMWGGGWSCEQTSGMSPRWLELIKEVQSDNFSEISGSCGWNIWLLAPSVDTLNNHPHKFSGRVDSRGGTKRSPAAVLTWDQCWPVQVGLILFSLERGRSRKSASVRSNQLVSSETLHRRHHPHDAVRPCDPACCPRPFSFIASFQVNQTVHIKVQFFWVKVVWLFGGFFLECPQWWRRGGALPAWLQTRGRPMAEPCRRAPGGHTQVGPHKTSRHPATCPEHPKSCREVLKYI